MLCESYIHKGTYEIEEPMYRLTHLSIHQVSIHYTLPNTELMRLLLLGINPPASYPDTIECGEIFGLTLVGGMIEVRNIIKIPYGMCKKRGKIVFCEGINSFVDSIKRIIHVEELNQFLQTYPQEKREIKHSCSRTPPERREAEEFLRIQTHRIMPDLAGFDPTDFNLFEEF